MAEELRQIKAPLGVGQPLAENHEYYAENPYSTAGIFENGYRHTTRLGSTIDNSFYIVGRDDKNQPQTKKNFRNRECTRQEQKPLDLLDHQPFIYRMPRKMASTCKYQDIHTTVSFSRKFVCKNMYEIGYGYRQIGKHIIMFHPDLDCRATIPNRYAIGTGGY